MTTMWYPQFIRFKTGRDQEDWDKLDPRMKGLLMAVAAWQYTKWEKSLTITCIVRTAEENAAVGGLERSAHVMVPEQRYARAADLRNNDLTLYQQTERRVYIEDHWNHGAPMFHVIDHDSGHGAHTHLNLNFGYRL